ncbi:outer membrane receptor protein involved in Fe transport [Lewinella aquimaris]|uniref:Outer membrane receptor protein involved in Fe transport n=1 Tax=Neolewinella aquimaris TaxID=1835722 RepID=A0A840E652_9BACT|nr:TonB-dependent receptor [Neolewinella aquimaris]MBB4078667.1 outer membrane receptor protein involved in Fe transport [Neolewinella aquimaris]
MKTTVFFAFAILFCSCVHAQFSLTGHVENAEGEAIAYANVALYLANDSSLFKAETTDNDGDFRINNLPDNTYTVVISYLGSADLRRAGLAIHQDLDLGTLSLTAGGIDLSGATVTATRTLVEVKPDRTIFNVQGTINAAGNDALDLLRKAPGVDVGINDNIGVLGRNGVLLYVDGKRIPLSGSELSSYLRNLTAERVDRIEIITSPGARYESEGNAGIIDIRLKKAENEGTNGSLAASGSQGRYTVYSLTASGNYRSRRMNIFGSVNYTSNDSYTDNDFRSAQNGFYLVDALLSRPYTQSPSLRAGADFYLGKRHTLGLLFTGQYQDGRRRVVNSTEVYTLRQNMIASIRPDSILRASVYDREDHNQNTFNLNYNFAIADGHGLNVDLDYGRYRNDNLIDQPNRYFSPDGELLSVSDNYFDTPIDIDIYTARLDYNFPVSFGAASAGAKFTHVGTNNAFLFYDVFGSDREFVSPNSNRFSYMENVAAAYLAFTGNLNENLSYNTGLRMEMTDATGELFPFANVDPETPVAFHYLSLFPNAGLTYAFASGNTLSLRYGRRINRPDYNVLNPFRVQLNELSYERGNPFLQPEIANNLELAFTLAKRYNFKAAYSRTTDQIAQLFNPDPINPQAGFITYANLAEQVVYSLNASAPVQVTPWWRAYTNASASYINNQADYGEDGVVDVQQFNYRAVLQNTFTLPGQFTAELTGQYLGPGISGGTFKYQDLGVVNVGLQRRFLGDQLSAKLTLNDIFYTAIIRGESDFNGLYTQGVIRRDSRRAGLSLSYDFGNQKVRSRRRDTGLDEAAGRVK